MTKRLGRRGGPLLAALVVVVLSAVACSSDGPATYRRCESPILEVAAPVDQVAGTTTSAPFTARPGGTLRVVGRSFGTACESADSPPLAGVRLYIEQGSLRLSVAEVNASPDRSFDVTFGVPTELQPGRARLSAVMTDGAGAVPLAVMPFEVVGA